MRLSYGPTLFEAGRIAAEQFLTLAYSVNLLSLVAVHKLAPQQPVSDFAQDRGRANFILDSWLELAPQVDNELLHKTAIWAHII